MLTTMLEFHGGINTIHTQTLKKASGYQLNYNDQLN